MTDPADPPTIDVPEHPTELPPPPPEPPRRVRRDVVPWFYGIGFLVLAGALAYLWQNSPPNGTKPAEMTAMEQQVHDLQAKVAELQALPAKVAQLEQRPAVPADLEQRLHALEQRAAPAAQPTAGLTADISQLAARVGAMEQKVASADQSVSQSASRYDSLANQLNTLSGRDQSAQSNLDDRLKSLGGQLSNVDSRVSALEKATSQVPDLANRTNRLARIQAAAVALSVGQPLGNLPDAPPALARFASTKPPTEAELQLSFPPVAQAALDASTPETGDKRLLDRVWARAQNLVTVRQGDQVLLGDPAAGIVARARTAVDAGDLRAAISALSQLKDGPAQAVADWVDRAKSLLAAREALVDLADHS